MCSMTHLCSKSLEGRILATATGVRALTLMPKLALLFGWDESDVSIFDEREELSMAVDVVEDSPSVRTEVAIRIALRKLSLTNTDGRLLLDL